MTALTRSARHLAALLSDSKATPERTPEEAKLHQEERDVAMLLGTHMTKLTNAAYVVTNRTWAIDANGVVCIWAGDQPTAWMNRRVFETLRGAPLTAEEMTEHAYKPEEE